MHYLPYPYYILLGRWCVRGFQTRKISSWRSLYFFLCYSELFIYTHGTNIWFKNFLTRIQNACASKQNTHAIPLYSYWRPTSSQKYNKIHTLTNWEKKQKLFILVQAVPDSMHKCVLLADETPSNTAHNPFVDDTLIVITKARMFWAIAASIKVLFIVFGVDEKSQKSALSMKIFIEALFWSLKTFMITVLNKLGTMEPCLFVSKV